MGINTPKIGNNSIDSMLNDEKLKNDFIEQMQLITKETGITLNIDTSNQGVARMIPGKKGVFFNPVFTLNLMKQIAEKREKELGIKSDFEFDIKHLSALVLHEINHMINRNDLKKSDKQIKFDGKTMNMAEYEKALHDKYGLDFHEFENRLEDIDVNNLATKIQAPIYENPKKEIYQNICIPDSDFSQNPLHEQLGRAALRESMIEYEKCTVDPMVRDILDYIGGNGGLLEIIRDPQLKYDEQLPAIAKLYEEYYLPLKKDAENQKKQNQNKQQDQSSNSEQQNQQQDQSSNSEQQNQQQDQSFNSEQQNQQQDQNPNSEQQNQQQDQNPNSEQQNQQQDQSSAKTGQQKSHARPMSLPHIFDDLESQLEDMAQNEDQKENDGKEPQNNSHDEKKTNNKTKEQKENEENEKNNKDKSIFDKLKDKIKDALGRKKDQQKDNTQKQLEDLLNDKKHEDTVNNPENDTDTSEKNNESDEISDELMRQFNERLEKQKKEKNKTPEDRQLEESIKQERGTNDENEIEQIKRQLEQQEEILKKIKQIKDKEGNSVYDKITEEIFKKIVNFRKYRSIYEKSPQPFSGGGQLSPHALVGGIMDWKNGDDDPRIMQQEKIEEKEKKKAGSFSITFILDGSGSMDGEKNIQQKLSTLIMLYALQQINDNLKSDEYSDMEKFAVENQVMMFEGGCDVETLKQRGKDLTRKDIIEITDGLDYCDGGDTNATDAIKLYYDQISQSFNDMNSEEYEERKEKVKSGEKKEIVFVLSDGDFNSGGDPKGYIQKMREMGIIVCGIGITDEGKNIIKYFGKRTDDPEKDKQGFGIVCKNANDLGTTLNELLVHHLSDPMIIGE